MATRTSVLPGRPVAAVERRSSRSPTPTTTPLVGTTWLAGDRRGRGRATAAAVDAAPDDAPAAGVRARRDSRKGLGRARRGAATEIGRALAGEAGKPIRDALTEVDRAAMTFHVASEEARRIGGDVIPLDLAPHGTGRIAIVRRFPIGPVAAISPFNFPLNLSAHKLAPADRRRQSHRAQARHKTPLSALFLASVAGRGRAAEGRAERPADVARARRPPRHRRSLQAPDLHRVVGGGLGDEGARRQEEGHPRARRQRRA